MEPMCRRQRDQAVETCGKRSIGRDERRAGQSPGTRSTLMPKRSGRCMRAKTRDVSAGHGGAGDPACHDHDDERQRNTEHGGIAGEDRGPAAQQGVVEAAREGQRRRGAGGDTAGQQPADGARRGQAPPPDAEHQQRAQRGRRDGEHQPDVSGQFQGRRRQRERQRQRRRRSAPPIRKSRTRPRSTSVASAPATLTSRPDEVARKAAIAPAAASAASSCPAGPRSPPAASAAPPRRRCR